MHARVQFRKQASMQARTHAQVDQHTHAKTQHKHTHTCTQTHISTRTHARTHARAHTHARTRTRTRRRARTHRQSHAPPKSTPGGVTHTTHWVYSNTHAAQTTQMACVHTAQYANMGFCLTAPGTQAGERITYDRVSPCLSTFATFSGNVVISCSALLGPSCRRRWTCYEYPNASTHSLSSELGITV